uniref:Putative mediator of rna polymerase ii transcription subunit 22 n=1 Tax=Aedes albopictus TaxID=7160 RepID=A0A023ECF6_AEDAL
MAHRNQIRVRKDELHGQRPNVIITRSDQTQTTDDTTEDSGPRLQGCETDTMVLPRGSIQNRKRKRQLSDSEQPEPRRSKRNRKLNRCDDFSYD